MNDVDNWDQNFFTRSPIFKPLHALLPHFDQLQHWPDIEHYQRVFADLNMPVRPVPQSTQISSYEEQYEQRVFLKGELQTRTENWHDFFNAMVWLSFPKTKSALNELHFKQASQRKPGSNRSLLENRITQFDECGAVIISDKPELLDLIRQHQWQELFLQNRIQFEKHIRCIVFGHAIYEKALNPYIGMTCHCILLEQAPILESSDTWHELDTILSRIWLGEWQKHPGRLQAYPILGTPGLWPVQDDTFYQNTGYFRKRR